MKWGRLSTSLGDVSFGGQPEVLRSRRPAVVMVPGAFRSLNGLVPWLGRLSDLDLIVSSLPGHDIDPELSQVSVEGFTTAYREALGMAFGGREILWVGESLAGLVGLGLNLPNVTVLAIDPPLSTDKLWPLKAILRRDFPKLSPQFVNLAREVFGMSPGRSVDRDYRGVVATIGRPVHVLTGDDPLFPIRRIETTPCLLDEEDTALLERHPLVTLHRTQGPHALLDVSPDACEALIRTLFAALPREAANDHATKG